MPKLFNLIEGVSATHHGTQGNGDDVDELVSQV
jgi:hypothetical protein